MGERKERESFSFSVPLEGELGEFLSQLKELTGTKRTAQILRGSLGALVYLMRKGGVSPSELGVISFNPTKRKPYALAHLLSKVLGKEIPPEVVERAIYGERNASSVRVGEVEEEVPSQEEGISVEQGEEVESEKEEKSAEEEDSSEVGRPAEGGEGEEERAEGVEVENSPPSRVEEIDWENC